METDAFLEAVRGDLLAALPEDESGSALAARISRALESSLRLRFLDALSQAAAELSEQLPSEHIELRLAGNDVHLVVAGMLGPESQEAGIGDEATARLTLRMPESLKTRVERASAREGVSTNSWLVQVVQRALEHSSRPRRPGGGRFTGFARS